jgi:hypothetical protein
MTEQEFLEHHGLRRNPFADEDAQTDVVFKEYCLDHSYHPAWSKVFGDPREPAAAIVLGPKGSGKTAMRLQMVAQLLSHNRAHPEQRVFFVEYDDFNAYLGPLQSRLPARIRQHPEKVLASVQLWDHLDAILCEATTTLVDGILNEPGLQPESQQFADPPLAIERLDPGQKRDMLLLAACYDQSRRGTFPERFRRLARQLRHFNLSTWVWPGLGIAGTLLAGVLGCWLIVGERLAWLHGLMLILLIAIASWLPYLFRYAGRWLTARRLVKHVRVGRRDIPNLGRLLMRFTNSELASQPLPTSRRSDDRYALLDKLQLLLRTLGLHGMIVFIDRVDEPELVNGLADRMKALVWPLLDNKLLKHPGLGLKLLLPSDLQYYLDRETREFHERARLDKQNFIGSFEWTGEALFDVVVARMRGCSQDTDVNPRRLFDDRIADARLIAAMQTLRTPRNLFRFLYRLIAEHCKQFRSSAPSYRISSETLEATLAVFLSELQHSAINP